MGFWEKIFGSGKGKGGERLILCFNKDCGKVFKEAEGLKPRKDVDITGLSNYKCPHCGHEFAYTREKLDSIQAKLKKQQ